LHFREIIIRSPSRLSASIAIVLLLLFSCSDVALAEAGSQAYELNAGTVYGGNASSSDSVEDLTHQILDKVIQLEKLNTRFRIETGLVSPWRQRRVFLYGLSNAMCTEASQIEAMAVRYSTLRKSPSKSASASSSSKSSNSSTNSAANAAALSTDEVDQADDFPFKGNVKNAPNIAGRLMTANSVQITGNAISGTGDIFELNLNFLNYLRIRKHHLAPAAYKEQADAMHAELIKLCDARTEAIKSGQFGDSELAVANAETKVLSNFKDLALVEYLNFHSSTRKFWAFQNTAFLVDLLKNSLAGSGNIVGLSGSHLRNPYAQGTAGILSICSGVVVLFTPIFGRVSGNLAGNASRRLISKDLVDVQAHNASEFRDARLELTGVLLKHPDIHSKARLPIYEKEEKLLLDMEKTYERQRKQARATLVENIAFAAAVGPPRMANGTLQILGSWHYHNNRRRANVLYVAGATTYGSSTGVNIFETVRVQAGIELNNYRRGKRGELPSQQLAKRLAVLNQMHSGIGPN
jgi:hypothetical protein